MAVVVSLNCHKPFTSRPHSQYPNFKTPSSRFSTNHRKHNSINFVPIKTLGHRHQILYKLSLSTEDSNSGNVEEAENEVDNIGVKAALSMLNFYKSEFFLNFWILGIAILRNSNLFLKFCFRRNIAGAAKKLSLCSNM